VVVQRVGEDFAIQAIFLPIIRLRNWGIKQLNLQFGLSKEAHSPSLYQSPSAPIHTVKFSQLSPAPVKQRGQRDKRATYIAGLTKMYVLLH
jgi:hypothetical protein